MANADPVAINVRMATSKAPQVTDFKPEEPLPVPQPGQPSSCKLLWQYSDTTIANFLIEHSVDSGVTWVAKTTVAKDKREVVVGGYPQGDTIKFRITAIKP